MSDDDWGEDDSTPTLGILFEARAKSKFIPESHSELTLSPGDLVYVLQTEVPGKPGHWYGERKGALGSFPSELVQKIEAGQVGIAEALAVGSGLPAK